MEYILHGLMMMSIKNGAAYIALDLKCSPWHPYILRVVMMMIDTMTMMMVVSMKDGATYIALGLKCNPYISFMTKC